MTKNLFVSLFPCTDNRRRNELIECLKVNSKVFDSIFILVERSDEVNFIPELPNLEILPVSTRPTFRTFFQCVNTVSKVRDLNIIANSDIQFEEIKKAPEEAECWALTRYEITRNGPTYFLNRADSQDSWWFRSFIKIPNYCDFPQGWGGCDNRIARELSEAGYNITNPSVSIRTFHLHEGEKSYNDQTPRVGRPYLRLTPIELNQ